MRCSREASTGPGFGSRALDGALSAWTSQHEFPYRPISLHRGWSIIDGRHVAQDVTTLDNARPLLETKLYVPRPRRGLVARPRLGERMSRGVESKLTLVSAPAGFGKTTLLAEWLASDPARNGPWRGFRSTRLTTSPCRSGPT